MTKETKAATVACIIIRDFWDDDGVRQRAGKEIDVSIDDAFAGIESGILARKKG